MGIFSGIKKMFTDVFEGIGRIFRPILEPLGRMLDSSIGKAIMLGMSIFTLGSAMIAGAGAFATTAASGLPGSFIGAFVDAGKAFMTTLTGVGAGEKAAASTTEMLTEGAAAAGNASQIALQTGGPQALVEGANAGAEMLGQGMTAGGNLSKAAAPATGAEMLGQGMTAGSAPAAGAGKGLLSSADMTRMATEAATGAESGNWLTKAAKAAGDFAMSEGGGQVVGSLIKGAGNYYTEKDRQEFEDRIRRDWMQGDKSEGVRNIRDQSARLGDMPTPSAQGVAAASGRTANANTQRPMFDRTYGAPAPAGG